MVQYNDRYFRIVSALVAAHFITVFGEKESLFQILLYKYYYIALGCGAVIAFVLITVINVITRKLDKHWDWRTYPIQRTGLQLLLGLILPALVAFLLAFLYFRIFDINILQTVYLSLDYPLIVMMLFLFNLYYLAYYFYLRMRMAEHAIVSKAIANTQNEKEVFMVNAGLRTIPIPLETICYFFRKGENNFVRTSDREDFLINQSLDAVEGLLNEKLFFRVNRKFIVNFNACKHFELATYGKLELLVKPDFNEPILISQKRAPTFKEWIQR